ncbi:MAG: cytochrome c biogenesis protein [halophilic archaeon J07HX5]|jgi:Cytochrome c biogenesis protein|nr:MAG: cytochrome c biogenesis protein [halophilic archaeon J07HX5]
MVDFESLRVGFAFGAGTATFFAPCALPLLPGYMAFFLGHENDSQSQPVASRLQRAFVVSLFASVGFFLVFTVLFGMTLAFGSQVLGNVALLELVVGPLLVVFGVGMTLGRNWLPTAHVTLPKRRQGLPGYVAFGVVYAAAAAGCTGPLFIGIASLGVSAGPVATVGMLAAYAAGMSLLLGIVTVLTALGRDTLVTTLTGNTEVVTRAAGIALILAGVVQLYWFLFVFNGTIVLEELLAWLV